MNTKAIAKLAEGIAHKPARVICLGEILFDCLADDLDKSVSEVSSWTPYPGGAPANVACALVKLGTPSAFIGCVGKDKKGHELVDLLQSIGVSISGVQYSDRFPTREVYVTRSADGDRTFAGFGERPRVDDVRSKGTRELGDKKADEFADAYLQAQYLPPELFLEAEFLVIGTLELAYPQSRAAVFRALELAEEYHLKIVLDVNWRPMFWLDEQEAMTLIKTLWQRVDFIKVAAEEAQMFFGTTDAGAITHRLNSVEGILVSDGGAKVSYCLSENEGVINPTKVTAKDTTGAGDAFLAGFIHQLCRYSNQQLQDPQIAKSIVEYACGVGSLTTTKPGAIAAQPTPEEVEAFLNKKQLTMDS